MHLRSEFTNSTGKPLHNMDLRSEFTNSTGKPLHNIISGVTAEKA